MDGGHQEKDKRAGTENVAGIVGLGKACELAKMNLERHMRHLKEIRDYSMQEKARLWDEIFRLEFPHNYYVDLTKNLLDFKIKMLEEKRK